MKFVLLFIAFGQQPSQLGVYDNLRLCQTAIRAIYTRQMTPQGVELSQETINMISKAVDMQVKYDNRYQCQPTAK
jgi:hypothetical protein